MSKKVVLYYSFEGNTKTAAEKIADLLKADIIRIETDDEPPRKGMKKILIGGMQVTFGMCPEIKDINDKIAEYDEIVLGTPIWAGKCAAAVNSFLKKYNCSDKITSVFTLSGSGNNEKCLKRLRKRLPSVKYTANLLDKGSQLASENDSRIETFVKEMNN